MQEQITQTLTIKKSFDMENISILFYNGMWNLPLSLNEIEFPPGFLVTEDRTLMMDVDAVVFHMPSLDLHGEYLKRDDQIWVYWSMECEQHYPHLNTPEVLEMFDVKMTYHQNADVITSYIEPNFDKELLHQKQPNQERDLINVFISSPFNKSGRFQFLVELMKYIEVHSYGKMFRNKTLRNDEGRGSKIKTYSKYKFTLGLENAIAKDYVTEKFFDPLIAGSIPVYLGAPNIDEFSPGNKSFINVNDFKSPGDLAYYLLELATDTEKYMKYFKWKSELFLPEFKSMLEIQKQHPFVRLCHLISVKKQQKNLT